MRVFFLISSKVSEFAQDPVAVTYRGGRICKQSVSYKRNNICEELCDDFLAE